MAEPDDDKGSSLTSVGAAAAALVAGIGGLTLTGALGRVQRNNGTWFAIALTLVVVGAGLWLASTLISSEARPMKIRSWTFGLRQLGQGLGVLLTLVGVAAGFATTVDAANDTEQPSVTVKVDPDTLVLTGNVTVENLSSQEHLTVFVEGLNNPTDSRGRYQVSYLSKAFVGPNGDGKASQPLSIHIPHGRFDAVLARAFTSDNPLECGVHPKGGPGDRKDSSGCVLIVLPPRTAARPQLTASWSGKPLGSALRLKLTIPAGTDPLVPLGLDVVGLRGSQRLRLYRLTIGAHGPGTNEREVELPVDPGVQTVCAQVSHEESGKRLVEPACPLRTAGGDYAAVELRVPQR